MKRIKLLFLLVFLLPIFAVEANACSCAGERVPCEAYWNASAVFVGTVSYVSPTSYKMGDHDVSGRLVHFTVDRPLRGVKGKEVQVTTGLGGGDCGYGFQLAGQYIVYAYRSKDSDRLFTGICSRTRRVAEATDDLAYVQGLSKAEPGATIFGEVQRLDRNAPWEERLKPVANARVVLEGPSKRVEAVTDKDGKYRVSKLPVGKYKATVKLPQGLSIHNPEREAEVFDRGCANIGFWAEADTKIFGKVLDAQGQPAVDVLMELVPQGESNDRYPSSVRTDSAGRYEMKLLQPGRYLLGVRIFGLAGATYAPFPRTYYPGVGDEAGATVITVAEGQQIELSEMVLPARFVEHTLKGIVVDESGRPVNGATVWLKEREYSDNDMPYRKETDSDGRFEFKTYLGINYHILAYIEPEGSKRKQAEIEVRVSVTTETLKFVLRPK